MGLSNTISDKIERTKFCVLLQSYEDCKTRSRFTGSRFTVFTADGLTDRRPTTTPAHRPIRRATRDLYHLLTIHSSLDSDDEFRSGCRNVSQCITNSPSQDYTHPDDHNLPTYDMTPGFKPFKFIIQISAHLYLTHTSMKEPACTLSNTF